VRQVVTPTAGMPYWRWRKALRRLPPPRVPSVPRHRVLWPRSPVGGLPYIELTVPLRNVTSFERPTTVEEAFALVAAGGTPVSGGTSVILRSSPEPRPLVDLTGLPIADIEADSTRVTVGATATLTAMLESTAVADLAGGVVTRMLRGVGSPLLRNVATIGGHIARGRLSDVVPVLLALDAEVAFHDGAEHTMPLSDFYAWGRHRVPVIITAIHIPVPVEPSAAHFEKMARTVFDIALLNAACRVDLADGLVVTARVVVGETPSLASRIARAEASMVGRPLDDDTIGRAATLAAEHVAVRDDERAGAEYRRHLSGILVGRCLTAIREHLS
jgi:CO/xanthine dehydrogenase FAD-binding subunit